MNGPAKVVDEIIRILVVDEDLPTRQATMEGLRRRGYEVVGAGDGLQALLHLQRAQVAVVITDIQMPLMDGVALLREIRQKGSARIIVYTTILDALFRELLCQIGAFDVVTKGEPLDDLFHVVEAAVQGRGTFAWTR